MIRLELLHLPYEKIDKIITSKNQEPPKVVKISYKTGGDYFPTGTTPREFEETIVNALDLWFKKNPKKSNKTTGIER